MIPQNMLEDVYSLPFDNIVDNIVEASENNDDIINLMDTTENMTKKVLDSLSRSKHRKLLDKIIDECIEKNKINIVKKAIKESYIDLQSKFHNVVYNGEGSLDMAKLFIKEGVNINHINERGLTPLMEVVYEVYANYYPYEAKKRFKKVEKTVRLLLDNGADPNIHARENGQTVLHMSLMMPSVLKTLLNHKSIDINAQDDDGNTVLHYHTYRYIKSTWSDYYDDIEDTRKQCMKILVNNRQGKRAGLNIKNKEGLTPFHFASDHYYDSILMIKTNRTKNIKSNKGDTPQYLMAMALKYYQKTEEEDHGIALRYYHDDEID